MATNKDSKKKTTTQKKVLGKSQKKSPPKNPVKKVDQKVTKGKRKAKRKKGFVPANKGTSKQVPTKVRKKSDWNIVSSAISKWCKDNGSRCSKKQISEIYQGLKERRLNGDPKYKLTPEDIELGIKGELVLNKGKKNEEKVDLLAYKNQESVPAQFKEFPWFNAPSFFNNDGLYFKDDDVLLFDLFIIGRGMVETTYKEFNMVYRDEMYQWITKSLQDYEEANNEAASPPPDFILNVDEIDLENRVFEWKLFYQSSLIPTTPTQEGQEKVTGIKDETLKSEKEVKEQQEKDLQRQIQQPAPMSEKEREELAIEKIKAEALKINAETEAMKAQTEAQNTDMKKIEMGLMTKAEFKKKWKGK
jgi:hypothetical protein